MVVAQDGTFEVARCPACGHRVEDSREPQCALCGYEFAADRTATSDDSTPFAICYSQERPGHRRMWKWIGSASAGRMKHLALMRSSAASAAFVQPYWLLLAAGMGLLLASHHGWRAVSASPAVEATGSIRPEGRGWLHVAAMPTPYRNTQTLSTPVDFWWNPPQTVVAGVAGFVSGLLLLWIVHRLIRAGIELSHRSAHRGEGRMSAALHYSLSWSVPLIACGFLMLIRPIGRIGLIMRWGWNPSHQIVDWVAGMIAALSFVLWWFWMLRLAAAAPPDSRARVAWFLGLGVPLLVAFAAAGWWVGLTHGLTFLFKSWKLLF